MNDTKIRGVLFDMDGVILDSESASQVNLIRIVREAGYDMDIALHDSLLGYNFADAGVMLRRHFGQQFPWEEILVRFKQATIESVLAGEIPLKEGAVSCIDGLRRRGIRTALATSSDRVCIDNYRQRYPIFRDGFDFIVCGDEVEHSKPEPDIYQIAAKGIGLETGACIGVEDSFLGLKSLRAAGVESVMIPDVVPFSDRFAPYVRFKLNSLNELCTLIDRLNLGGRVRC